MTRTPNTIPGSSPPTPVPIPIPIPVPIPTPIPTPIPIPIADPTLMRDGPRERLGLLGEQQLSDVELLCVVLGTGTASEPVSVIAARVLAELGGLPGLRRASLAQLAACSGIGPTKAARLRAALELGARAHAPRLHPRAPIRCSADVVAALSPRLRNEPREQFLALCLDAKNRPVAELVVAVGGLSACALTPAEVFRLVLREPAAAVIFIHNHPSGEPSPSPEDVAVTRRLVQAAALLGLRVLDHVILGDPGHFSFLDAGLLAAVPAR
jgi:DNA repair protein RadC